MESSARRLSQRSSSVAGASGKLPLKAVSDASAPAESQVDEAKENLASREGRPELPSSSGDTSESLADARKKVTLSKWASKKAGESFLPSIRLFDPDGVLGIQGTDVSMTQQDAFQEGQLTANLDETSAGEQGQVVAEKALNGLEKIEALTFKMIEDTAAMRSNGWVSRPNAKPVGLPELPQLAPTQESFEKSNQGAEGPGQDFLDELQQFSLSLENSHPIEILRWAIDRYQDRFTFATAFGPEGMSILYFLSKIDPQVRVFNLDTGYQFKETLELRDRVEERFGIDVKLFKPDDSVAEFEAANGGPVYRTDPTRCCFERKIKVLHRATKGMESWASAIRRDQSPDRAKAPIVGWDAKFSLVKVSPLANWTSKQVWQLIMDERIPYNPLHDQGYTSIGCQPCTRPVGIGEDERAGRWSGSKKTECGLHSLD